MKAPEDHRKLAAKRDFFQHIEHSVVLRSRLSKSEYEILDIKGYWLEGLASGRLLAYTDAQLNFVEFCKKRSFPTNIYESAWLKYVCHIENIKKENEDKEKKRIEEENEIKRQKEILRKKKLEDFLSKRTPEKIERSKRIIKNSIMMGVNHFLKIKDEELKKGYIDQHEVDIIFNQYKSAMPDKDMTKVIGSTDGLCTTGGHDPFR